MAQTNTVQTEIQTNQIHVTPHELHCSCQVISVRQRLKGIYLVFCGWFVGFVCVMSYGCALLFLGFVQMKSSFSCSIHCSQGRIFAPSLPVPAPILHCFFLTLLLWRVRGKIRQSKELDSWGHFGGHCVNDFQ